MEDLPKVETERPSVEHIPGGIVDDQEEEEILRLVSWIEEQDLPEPELMYELADRNTNETVAVLDVAWPKGLQTGLSSPSAFSWPSLTTSRERQTTPASAISRTCHPSRNTSGERYRRRWGRGPDGVCSCPEEMSPGPRKSRSALGGPLPLRVDMRGTPLPVNRQRLQVRPHHPADSANLTVTDEVIHSASALAPAILQGFNGYIESNLVPVLEAISHRLGGCVDGNRNPIYVVLLHPTGERRS